MESSESFEHKQIDRFELGRDLLKLREQIVASGEPLLTIEELDKESAERRGDRSSLAE